MRTNQPHSRAAFVVVTTPGGFSFGQVETMNLIILCPHYTLGGRLWHKPIVPNANYVGYNHQLDGFDPERRRYAPHAQEACRRFAETLRDLCAAGF